MALLGDFAFPSEVFSDLDKVFERFRKKSFLALNIHEKSKRINHTLYEIDSRKGRLSLSFAIRYRLYRPH